MRVSTACSTIEAVAGYTRRAGFAEASPSTAALPRAAAIATRLGSRRNDRAVALVGSVAVSGRDVPHPLQARSPDVERLFSSGRVVGTPFAAEWLGVTSI